MSKKSKYFVIVFATIVTFFSLTSLAISQINRKVKDDLYSQIELFSYALTTIQSDYVDELPPKDLIYGSLKGMLGSLDPHSQFLDPEEYTDLKTETEGKFGGLGIEISIRDRILTVISPIEDTPAWKAGLKAGDLIVEIEGESTQDITLSEAVGKLRGKPGTDVTITVLRESEKKFLDFTITREIIRVQDVKYTQILEDKIGFIRLTEFREDSAKAFRKAVDELRALGAESLILDLRNNPGGLLSVANAITEEFLPAGEIIVSTKGRRESQNTVTYSNNKKRVIEWPVVVLINKGSASGSEILAGALKDNGRAIIMGTQSFGKGSVQSVIPLPDGSGLRLTTSKYFTPSGVSIHEKGIKPDIIVEFIEQVEDKEEDGKVKDVFEELQDEQGLSQEEMAKKKQEKVRERLLNNNQIQSAMSVLKGIKVFEKVKVTREAALNQ